MGTDKLNRKEIHVLFTASEADPFIKVGGLGDVAGALPGAIKEVCLDQSYQPPIDIRLVIPLHSPLRSQIDSYEYLGEYNITTQSRSQTVQVYHTDQTGFPVYLLDGDPIRDSVGVYSSDPGMDAHKYFFFSLACLHLPEFLNWRMDILHANDWHTALAVYACKALPLHQNKKIKTVLSVHNLPYMGEDCRPCLEEFQIPPYPYGLLPSWAQRLPMPLGLATADLIIPVSPGYAAEIQTPEFGCGLERLLQSKTRKIVGIINGLNQNIWDPNADGFIEKKYNQNSIAGKSLNKTAIQDQFGLIKDAKVPLLTMVTRMDQQKGVDTAIEALTKLADLPWQMIFLGTGNPQIQAACTDLARNYPDKVKVSLSFNASLAHQLYAGSDMFLMPSRYEPCGLSQMIAMRYGSIPVARATGGLKNTIIGTSENSIGTGYLYQGIDASSLADCLATAIKDYDNKSYWSAMMQNAMNMDFSWKQSAEKYVNQYYALLSVRK